MKSITTIRLYDCDTQYVIKKDKGIKTRSLSDKQELMRFRKLKKKYVNRCIQQERQSKYSRFL
jgi:hypothetical protein